jgi:hypothetical protein
MLGGLPVARLSVYNRSNVEAVESTNVSRRPPREYRWRVAGGPHRISIPKEQNMVGRVRLLIVLSVAAHTLVLNAQTAQLGGPPSAFTTRFGEPIRDSGFVADFDKSPGRTALSRWGITVQNGYVTLITRNARPGERLDPDESAREARHFVLPDARSVRSFQTSDGWTAQERRSLHARETLPASAFKTCKGPAPPGTFSYVLSPERNSWSLALGTCP